MNTTSTTNVNPAGNGQTINGKCPHCGYVETFHSIENITQSDAHTPGEIRLDAEDATEADVITERYHFLQAGKSFGIDGFTLQGIISRADAERIRDCWNQHDDLLRQKDKLRAALMEIQKATAGSTANIALCVLKIARAALAGMEGWQ